MRLILYTTWEKVFYLISPIFHEKATKSKRGAARTSSVTFERTRAREKEKALRHLYAEIDVRAAAGGGGGGGDGARMTVVT